ncbi:hypothetical protein IQ06DRAFT_296370 [Phaeosphaeriaceae sp. SRC1lsM3a]|nr:hypothetical protein IQ06DRAFT_296370 [Stagonospora sp. SRC1lsM3a]
MRAHTSGSVPQIPKQNTYESRTGSQVVLEFADPTLTPHKSPQPSPLLRHHSAGPPPTITHRKSWTGPPSTPNEWLRPHSVVSPTTPGQGQQTRLQMTFEALKRMGAGMASPRVAISPRRNGSSTGEENVRTPGYFDVVSDTDG